MNQKEITKELRYILNAVNGAWFTVQNGKN